MKKLYRYDELSDRKCYCGRRLKKNLLAKKPNATKCFSCTKPRRKENKRANKEARRREQNGRIHINEQKNNPTDLFKK